MPDMHERPRYTPRQLWENPTAPTPLTPNTPLFYEDVSSKTAHWLSAPGSFTVEYRHGSSPVEKERVVGLITPDLTSKFMLRAVKSADQVTPTDKVQLAWLDTIKRQGMLITFFYDGQVDAKVRMMSDRAFPPSTHLIERQFITFGQEASERDLVGLRHKLQDNLMHDYAATRKFQGELLRPLGARRVWPVYLGMRMKHPEQGTDCRFNSL